MSALDDARQAGLLAKHRPTLAYHRQEPYWASSPAIMTDCAVEGRYATVLQTRGGELIAQAGPIARAPATRPRVPERDDLRRTASRGGRRAPTTSTPTAAPTSRTPPACRRCPGLHGTSSTAATSGGRATACGCSTGSSTCSTTRAWPASALHEGDWEMVQVAIDDGRPPAVDVRAAQRRREARRLGRRPHGGGNGRGIAARVYVGLGSHASYFDPGEYRISLFPMLDHARGNGRRGAPARRRTDGRRRWLEWPGRWGRMGPSDTSSPRGRSSTRSSGSARTRSTPTPADGGCKLGPIYVASPVAAPYPLITARRDGDGVLISYDVRAAEEPPARLLLSSSPRNPTRRPPRTRSSWGRDGRPSVTRRASARATMSCTRRHSVRRTPRATPSPSLSRLRDATDRSLPARASRCGCWSSSPTTGAAVSPRCARRSAPPSVPTPTAAAGRSDTCSRPPAGARDRRDCASHERDRSRDRRARVPAAAAGIRPRPPAA